MNPMWIFGPILALLVFLFGYILPRNAKYDAETHRLEACAFARHDWHYLYDKQPQSVDDELKMARIYEKVVECGGTELKPRYL